MTEMHPLRPALLIFRPEPPNLLKSALAQTRQPSVQFFELFDRHCSSQQEERAPRESCAAQGPLELGHPKAIVILLIVPPRRKRLGEPPHHVAGALKQ